MIRTLQALHDALADCIDTEARKDDQSPRRAVETVSLSVDEAAAMTGVGRGSIYAMLRDGRLARIKIGRRTLIPAASVRALVAQDIK